MTTNHSTRRAFLKSAPLVAAAMAATDNLSLAAGKPDAELIRLGKELDDEFAIDDKTQGGGWPLSRCLGGAGQRARNSISRSRSGS